MQTQNKTKNLSLTLLLLVMLVLAPAAIAAGASLSTDQEDYAPWEIVTINGSGFDPNSAITLTMVWPDGWVDTFDAMTDDSGGFSVWYGKEKYEGTYTVTATDSFGNTATTTFTDATNYNTDITLDAITSPLTAGQTGVSYQGRVSPSTAGDPQVPNGAPVTLEYQLSGSADIATTNTTSGNGTFSSTFTAPTAGGTYKFRARFAKFTQGSGGSAVSWNSSNSGWQTVVVNSPTDTTPPDTSITSGPSGWINTTEATFIWTGSDNVTPTGNLVYSYTLDGADWSAYSSGTTVTLTALSEGAHTFQVRAKDEAGNVDPSPDSRSFSVDATAPAIAAITINDDDPYTNNRNVTLTLSAYDAFGVTGYCVTDDSGTATVTVVDPAQVNFTATIAGTLSSAGDGTKTVAVQYRDAVGNWSVSYTDSIILDTTPPVVNVSFPSPIYGQNGWFNAQDTVPVVGTVTATDSSSNVMEIYLEVGSDGTLSDVKDLGTPSASGTLTVSGDGLHVVICDANDGAGNTGTGQTMFGIDTTPPTLTKVLSGTEGTNGWYTSNVTVTLTGDDVTSGLDRVEYKIGDGDWTIYTEPFIISDEGTTTLYHRAYDKAGNVFELTSQDIKIDKTPPVITAGTPIGASGLNGWWVSDVTVPFIAEDNLSGFAPDGALSTTMASKTTSGEGSALTVTSDGISDMAGNPATVVQAGPFKVDKTPPVVTITLPGTGTYLLNQPGLNATWSATDPSPGSGVVPPDTGTISIDTSSIGTKTLTLPAGTAHDVAGNSSVAVTATYYIHYAFGGILQPINAEGDSIFKLGSTVPVKFRLTDAAGNFVVTAVAKIWVAKIGNAIVGDELEAISTSAATTGNLFRYSLTDNQYIFNLGTKSLTAGTWQIRIELDDGTSQYVNISLRK